MRECPFDFGVLTGLLIDDILNAFQTQSLEEAAALLRFFVEAEILENLVKGSIFLGHEVDHDFIVGLHASSSRIRRAVEKMCARFAGCVDFFKNEDFGMDISRLGSPKVTGVVVLLRCGLVGECVLQEAFVVVVNEFVSHRVDGDFQQQREVAGLSQESASPGDEISSFFVETPLQCAANGIQRIGAG